jgi:hypothetical protein
MTSPNLPPRRDVAKGRRLAPRLALSVWVAVVLLVSAYLLGGHLLTLPKPAPTDSRLTAAIATARGPNDLGRWFVLHVLYEGCRCSARVLDHLLSRGASPFGAERVLLVGDPTPDVAKRITSAGYELESLTSEQIDLRFGIQAAPLMIVSDATNKIRYVGGYTDRKQSPDFHDLEIFAALSTGRTVSSLPVFGCAVSADLQAMLDPFGLRR